MFRIVCFFFVFIKISYSQVDNLDGRVLSNGSPLPGASVIISGTKIGTITDQYGNFTLNISKIKNPKIIISYLEHKSFSQKVNNIKNIGSIELEIDDQLNEVFKPYGVGILEYNLRIYNRWGQEIFYSNSIDIGWDGTTGDGINQANVGIYLYRIEVKNIYNQDYSYQGDLKLLR